MFDAECFAPFYATRWEWYKFCIMFDIFVNFVFCFFCDTNLHAVLNKLKTIKINNTTIWKLYTSIHVVAVFFKVSVLCRGFRIRRTVLQVIDIELADWHTNVVYESGSCLKWHKFMMFKWLGCLNLLLGFIGFSVYRC